MALTITDTSKSSVTVPSGMALKDYLDAKLHEFSNNSSAANALLTPIFNGDYKIEIRAAGGTAASGRKVNVDVNETIFDKGTQKQDGLKECVESTVFELVNAKNSTHFLTLDTQLKAGTLCLSDYGDQRGDFEAEASWTVAMILRELAQSALQYSPSEWGRKQVDSAANYLGGGLPAYEPAFRLVPHVAGRPANDKMGLPTAQFYAFNGAVTLGGMGDLNGLDVPAQLRIGGIRYSMKKIVKTAVGPWAINISTHNAANALAAYRAVTEYLAGNPAGCLVTWQVMNASARWTFSNAMKQVTPPQDSAVADIKGKIEAVVDKIPSNQQYKAGLIYL